MIAPLATPAADSRYRRDDDAGLVRARLPPDILTHDRRVRVFVSSTLEELAAERRSAHRGAIKRLRLTPVLMFELGARHHPPRQLYRSYLAQSDVFIGIYGDKYGWVAPDSDISGLEDEYRLSGGIPKLMYVRRRRQIESRGSWR